jgi:hypothetical protein
MSSPYGKRKKILNMNLKNYTSEIPASRSLDNIERRLIDFGAKSIIKDYDDKKRVASIKFIIMVRGRPIAFLLPANIDKVEKVLLRNYKNITNTIRAKVKDQAERTAWKTIHEWVEIQTSLIMMEQVEVMQVLLPYAITDNGRTVYEVMEDAIHNGDVKMLE